MISLPIIVYFLLIHWFADFALQTDEQANKKSVDIKPLALHVGAYSLMWLLASYIISGDWIKAMVFATITFVTHLVIDFITSRINKEFREKEDYHNLFVSIGFDQILHYLQLFLCYLYILA